MGLPGERGLGYTKTFMSYYGVGIGHNVAQSHE